MTELWQWFTPWWSDLASFGRMGKHGLYVWASVGLTVLALGLEWGVLRQWVKRQRRQAMNRTFET
jgi:heme exporter protein CcmD